MFMFHPFPSLERMQMKEFAVSGEDEEMVSSHLCAELCDVACFCYDQSNPNSFEYAANLQVCV
jgi:peptidyl-tRNA hydrolase